MEPPDLCDCKFPAAALHGRSVDFKIQTDAGIKVGKGRLIVEADQSGRVRAAIRCLQTTNRTMSAQGATVSAVQEYWSLSQEAVNALTQNPSGSECDFALIQPQT
jgi:hypothetical protein